MNLHRIVSGAVGTVNRRIELSIQRSTGYTTGGDGKRIPSYAPAVPVMGQVQSLQYDDLVQIDGLNLQGEKRAIYLEGNWEGIVRSDQKGGDIITFPDGTVWLVAQVLENWSDRSGWVKVAATLQNGS